MKAGSEEGIFEGDVHIIYEAEMGERPINEREVKVIVVGAEDGKTDSSSGDTSMKLF
jgi:hypothetical protein